MGKLLVLYVFHIYNERVKNFIENCIFNDENIDFIVISNNKNNVFKVPDYVKILLRDNIGYDFGGWSEALLKDKLYKKYENFIFVNSSVIGPFLPPNYKGKWTDIYINGLKDNIKLFGSTIHCITPYIKSKHPPHVQSYIFCLNISTLEYLINCDIFSITKFTKTFKETIKDREIGMSRKILENNWNIGSLLPLYKDVDFTFRDKKPEDYNIKFVGELMSNKKRGNYWKADDLVFIKGNRIKDEMI